MRKPIFILLSMLLILFPKSILADGCCSVEKKQNCKPQSWWSKGWGTTVFSGILTSQTSSRIIQKADFGDSGIAAIAVSKELVRFFNNRLGFEYEGQAVQHFGDQDHFELNPAILVARWWSFPWNKTLPTTIAIGDGVSIATRTPNLERERRGKETSKVLNFVMAEITLSNPCYPNWAFVLRYHHRSGVFGTYNGVHDASTAFAAGLKYWF
ncbi:MAG: hypothetical protein ACD_16C00130G0020 [uncultured bacterium]|nr:MAG: hypothetical protein ACD_16C00130G0020 [uncultured bacterium]OFW69590.1 MAG: hypothetical protein A2X70_01080 [Alphaproteobacteria bacterium GWC2_42_16]OFW74114.1 MAG: hypothetical protein A2Z80_04745 [Alphaproteobacteria bacterium GWA2_41_27]OFW84422.1 MAG: hypothetical protein A3E50_03430 [Alphaproteobacteria bacterium RIFCSPHIGHO2_12_FULL_42_100]OFW85943.1 MAG: hypothetical protein A2W06_05310 [Alphaproteobacteria bacterium RBG_16_42_14]OFW92269.1 MAG: hypothetical protein A3C41_030